MPKPKNNVMVTEAPCGTFARWVQKSTKGAKVYDIITAKTRGTRTLCSQYSAAEDKMMAIRRRHIVRTFSAEARDSLCCCS